MAGKKTGRPTKYSKEILPLVTQFCLLGATDEELARNLGIALSTLHLWKGEHPEFMDAIKEGKELADARVTSSLYQRALNGDTTAMIFWLKNRSKKYWRDKIEHAVEVSEKVSEMPDEELERIAKEQSK